MTKVRGVVLLEGPDGAGKTTLAEELCKRYDGHYVHRTWRRGMDVWDHHVEALQIANERAHEQLVVIDRLWPSEAIYGKIYRKESDYKHNSRAMDRVLLRFGAIYTLCVPQDLGYISAVHARKAQEGLEMYATVDDVAQRYQHWIEGSDYYALADADIIEQQAALGGFKKLRDDYYHYDVTRDGHNLKLVCQGIAHTLRARQESQFQFALDPNTPNCLGHKKDAKFLFVGEQVGDLHAWSRWPFFARTHSPDYINAALHKIAFNEKLGVWCNAWDDDNRLPFIFDERPDLRVIALGRKAENRCKSLNIPVHAALPHPQWARRFNHHGQRGTPYPELLREATDG